MIRRLYLVMTIRDEESLSAALVRQIPTLAFVDGTTWPTESPPLASSISAASASRVLLWDRELVLTLPTIRDAHGSFVGPSTRDVVSCDKPRLLRDTNDAEVLVSGGLVWSSNTPSERALEFQRSIWRVTRNTLGHKVRVHEGGMAEGFLAGPDAVDWWAASPSTRWFGLNAIRNVAVPASDATDR